MQNAGIALLSTQARQVAFANNKVSPSCSIWPAAGFGFISTTQRAVHFTMPATLAMAWAIQPQACVHCNKSCWNPCIVYGYHSGDSKKYMLARYYSAECTHTPVVTCCLYVEQGAVDDDMHTFYCVYLQQFRLYYPELWHQRILLPLLRYWKSDKHP